MPVDVTALCDVTRGTACSGATDETKNEISSEAKLEPDGDPACSRAATRSSGAYLDFQDALMSDPAG